MPTVTVVIPTRDRAEILPDTLEALGGQSFEDLEIIVVDDGSTDETPAAIEAAAANDPRVRGLRHDSPQGAASARNTGAAQARGRYLLFEDDDCVSEPEKVERLVSALEVSPAAGYAYCWCRMRHSDGSETVHGRDGPWSITTACAMIPRATFETVGRFDPELPRLQDFDLFTRLLARHEAVEVPEVLFTMDRGDEGISASDERLVVAARHLRTKYDSGPLPPAHHGAMHRRIAGKVLFTGHWRLGLVHFVAAIRAHKRSLRSWLGLTLALMGPPVYRWVAKANYRLISRPAESQPTHATSRAQ